VDLVGGFGSGSRVGGFGGGSSQAELDAYTARLEEIQRRLDDMNALMAETIRHYYWVNGFKQPGGGQGLHELLFPQYWKGLHGHHGHGEHGRRHREIEGIGAGPVRVRIDVRPCHPLPSAPPLVGPAVGLQAPIAPLPISPEQLAQLPAPPLPARLKSMLESALATPWDSQESATFYFEADRELSPNQIQGALGVLPELEAALGVAFGKTPYGHYGTTVDVTARDGFEKLAAQRYDGKSSATGAYLFRLAALYLDYKAEYYGLQKAIQRDLYHRDPCSIHPRVQPADARAYLETKYAMAMEGLIWRTARTSSPIMLDLDGDGQLAVTGRSTAKDRAAENGFVAEGSVSFDLDGDGRKERIEWMAGDGMLVDDRDGGVSMAASGDGEIDGTRLFGDEGGRYANGYQKLQGLDADGDGRLSGSELEGLSVWLDDGDARVQAGEIKTLAELGISELSTQMAAQRNASGESLMRSTFVQNGETKATEDVWFARESR
jgi:hypothetical protein